MYFTCVCMRVSACVCVKNILEKKHYLSPLSHRSTHAVLYFEVNGNGPRTE